MYDKLKQIGIDWNKLGKNINSSYVLLINTLVLLVNKLFKLRTLVLMGAISAASLDFFLIMNNFTTTYSEFEAFSSYMALGILFSLIVTEIILFHPFKYKASKVPTHTRSQKIEVVAEYERNKIKWKNKEKRNKTFHYLKWIGIKGMMGFVFSMLVMVNLNFSYGELSSSIGKKVHDISKDRDGMEIIERQISAYNISLDNLNISIQNLDPLVWKTKRENLLKEYSEISKLRDGKLEALKNIGTITREDTLRETSLRYTYIQLKEVIDISIEQYVSYINMLLSVSIICMYLFLTYVYTVLGRAEDVQVVKLKKKRK